MLIDNAPEITKQFKLERRSSPNILETSYKTLNLDINDKHIVDFYEEWQEISSIRRKSPSGEKLYNIWLKDIYERYNFPLEDAAQVFEEFLPFN